MEFPAEQLAAISKIRDLSDTSADELIAALESSRFTPEPRQMAETIAERVPSIRHDDLASIVEGIYDLYFVRELSNVPPARFLNDLVDSIRPKLSLGVKDVSHVRDRFRRLLEIETLNTLSKAIRLQRDGERLYCEAKILSDIRPVFGDDVKTEPSGAVVTHTLKLSYHEGGTHKEFFVVLDSQDLDTLKRVVARAHAKGKTLRNLLERTKLPDLGI